MNRAMMFRYSQNRALASIWCSSGDGPPTCAWQPRGKLASGMASDPVVASPPASRATHDLVWWVRQMATEIRFAFALNGGVSLAIWIGGVVDEVLRFVDAGKRAAHDEHDDANPYIALCRRARHRPHGRRPRRIERRRSQRRVLGNRRHPRLHQPASDQATVVGPWLLRQAAAAPERRFAHLGAQRRRQLPAAHRAGVRAPREERHRVRRRRPSGDGPAHGNVARRADHDDQRRPRRARLRRPPRRVHLQEPRLRLRRRRPRDPTPFACVPLDRVVSRRVRAEHGARRPLRPSPRHRALRRSDHPHDPVDRRRGARQPARAEHGRGHHPPAVARAHRARARPRRARPRRVDPHGGRRAHPQRGARQEHRGDPADANAHRLRPRAERAQLRGALAPGGPRRDARPVRRHGSGGSLDRLRQRGPRALLRVPRHPDRDLTRRHPSSPVARAARGERPADRRGHPRIDRPRRRAVGGERARAGRHRVVLGQRTRPPDGRGAHHVDQHRRRRLDPRDRTRPLCGETEGEPRPRRSGSDLAERRRLRDPVRRGTRAKTAPPSPTRSSRRAAAGRPTTRPLPRRRSAH